MTDIKKIDSPEVRKAHAAFEAATLQYLAVSNAYVELAARRLQVIELVAVADATIRAAEADATSLKSPLLYAPFHHQLRMFLLAESLRMARLFANAHRYERGWAVEQSESILPREAIFDTKIALVDCKRSRWT